MERFCQPLHSRSSKAQARAAALQPASLSTYLEISLPERGLRFGSCWWATAPKTPLVLAGAVAWEKQKMGDPQIFPGTTPPPPPPATPQVSLSSWGNDQYDAKKRKRYYVSEQNTTLGTLRKFCALRHNSIWEVRGLAPIFR